MSSLGNSRGVTNTKCFATFFLHQEAISERKQENPVCNFDNVVNKVHTAYARYELGRSKAIQIKEEGFWSIIQISEWLLA